MYSEILDPYVVECMHVRLSILVMIGNHDSYYGNESCFHAFNLYANCDIRNFRGLEKALELGLFEIGPMS